MTLTETIATPASVFGVLVTPAIASRYSAFSMCWDSGTLNVVGEIDKFGPLLVLQVFAQTRVTTEKKVPD